MKLLVNIDDNSYKVIKSPLDCCGRYDSECYNAIYRGKPLNNIREEINLMSFTDINGTEFISVKAVNQIIGIESEDEYENYKSNR